MDDARLIATREALRALPTIAPFLDKDPEERCVAMLLPTLRALLAASRASISPKPSEALRDAAVAATRATRGPRDKYAAADGDRVDGIRPAYAIDAAASAAFSADDAVATQAARVTSDYAQAAFAARAATDTRAAYAADATALHAWRAVTQDATALERGEGHTSISHTPLWPNGRTPTLLSRQWGMSRRHLMTALREEQWEPWVHWYEGILTGFNGDQEL